MRCLAQANLLLVLVASWRVQSHTADEWKSRVIYQLLTDRFANPSQTGCSNLQTYCGGTLQGIISKLDYIQGLGANAIWISPIPVNTPNGYHGYWAMDITRVNPHFGTSDDLKELVNACHQRGIWVMLDVVANHMGNQAYGDWNNFTYFVPFNQQEHYHKFCEIKDFNDQQQVEICRLADLPDLNQTTPYVDQTLNTWINNIVNTYQFDGLRVDTTPEVPKWFWSQYSQSAGVFTMGEVFNGDPNYVAGYQGYLSSTLNYPMYYRLLTAFQQQQSMRNIHDGVTAEDSVFRDVSVLGNFLDNHDNPRFLHGNSQYTILYNALAYIIFSQGIPIIYYGTEQGYNGGNDPNNRAPLWPYYNTNHPIYQFISTCAKFRTQQGSSLYTSQQIERYVDDQFFAFTRNQVLICTTNTGSSQSISRTITYHPYNTGQKLVNLLDSSDVVTVGSGGIPITMSGGMPKVYYPTNQETGDQDELSHQHYITITISSSTLLLILIVCVMLFIGIVVYRRHMTTRSAHYVPLDAITSKQ